MAVNHLGTLRLDIHHNRASGLRCRGGAGFDKDHLASKKSEFSAKILRFFFFSKVSPKRLGQEDESMHCIEGDHFEAGTFVVQR